MLCIVVFINCRSLSQDTDTDAERQRFVKDYYAYEEKLFAHAERERLVSTTVSSPNATLGHLYFSVVERLCTKMVATMSMFRAEEVNCAIQKKRQKHSGGEDDDIVEFSEFFKFRDAIQKTKNSFTLRSYSDAGHFYFRGSSQKDSDERRKLTEEFLLKNGF